MISARKQAELLRRQSSGGTWSYLTLRGTYTYNNEGQVATVKLPNTSTATGETYTVDS